MNRAVYYEILWDGICLINILGLLVNSWIQANHGKQLAELQARFTFKPKTVEPHD